MLHKSKRKKIILFFFMFFAYSSYLFSKEVLPIPAFPDYILINDDVVLEKDKIYWFSLQKETIVLRFDNLDLPIESESIPIKFFFDIKNNTKVDNSEIKVKYINPSNGGIITKILPLNKTKNCNELILTDNLPITVFNEKGEIIILLEKTQKTPEIGIKNESFMILNLDSNYSETIAGSRGIVFPTADSSKISILNWNRLIYEKNKLGFNISSLFLPRKGTKDSLSKLYLLVDIKYILFPETNINPTLAIGCLTSEGLINTDYLQKKMTYNLYCVSTKNLNKVFNLSVGFLHGNLFNMFINNNEKLEIESTSFLFVNMFLRLSPGSALKFETGYNFNNFVDFYNVSYSCSMFKDFITFDIGSAITRIKTEKNNDLFIMIGVKI